MLQFQGIPMSRVECEALNRVVDAGQCGERNQAWIRRVFGSQDGTGIAALLIGPVLGFGFSVFGVFLAWAAGLQNWLAVVMGPGVTWLNA